MRRKNQKPPICIGGSEKLRAMDRPRYMNVPSPAPCHVNVAGVGKQSVWGLRIIACISVFTLTSFQESVKTQKWGAGRESNPDLQLRTLPCCSVTLPTLWNSRRESNPDLFVRTEASSCFRPREPRPMWRGCRELNSDLKVRSLAPSSVGPHPHIGSGREI